MAILRSKQNVFLSVVDVDLSALSKVGDFYVDTPSGKILHLKDFDFDEKELLRCLLKVEDDDYSKITFVPLKTLCLAKYEQDTILSISFYEKLKESDFEDFLDKVLSCTNVVYHQNEDLSSFYQ